MESCWAHLAHHRSHVHDILKELQKKDVCIIILLHVHAM